MLRGRGSRHLVVWFRVARKLMCTGLIRNSKGKRLVMVKEGISTPSASYLR
jgi:hypothetical protein